MKGNGFFLVILGVIVLILAVSLINANRSQTAVSLAVVSDVAEGLDLKTLTEVVKTAKGAEDLEKRLNEPGGINNLDLNEDGKVDFISVTEYGNKKDAYGFSLTVQPDKGETQEIASIEIAKEGDNANIEVRGNEQIYGSGHYYHGYHPIGSFLMWSYLLRPHPYYLSPWYRGYYPGYYRTYGPVGRSVYSSRAGTMSQSSNATRASSSRMASKTGLSNPNQGKTANKGITQRLRNPTATQKSFQSRNPSKAARRGGFGSTRSSSRSRSTGSRGK